MILAILQILLSLLIPLGVVWAEPRSRFVRVISPVILCYGVGMAFGNQPWLEFSNPVSLTLCNITVALAIPLLLFSVNIVAWLRLARNTVISFVLVMASVMIVGALAHLLFRDSLERTPEMAGMLVGVYTGGTPNMAAIGTALGVPSQTFILLNAADMVASFAYLVFILALAAPLLRRIVPATPREDGATDGEGAGPAGWTVPSLRVVGISLALTLAIVAAGVGAGFLLPSSSRDAVIILGITTLGVAASLNPRVRALHGTQDMGQFLLLVFCVAMGFTTDFSELFSSTPVVFLYTAVILNGAVVLHFLLAILLRIDRDTIIITSAAGIFGPHMVGPVTMNLKNRAVLFSGLASGLVGYAAGNYLGMALAWLLS